MLRFLGSPVWTDIFLFWINVWLFLLLVETLGSGSSTLTDTGF